tara:strand:- start:3106 stop:4074 length:969 start_codon:yes stop_codon:yes gene_type:complete
MLCNCEKPQQVYSFTDITKNKVIYRCPITTVQYQDLKQSKNGAWPLVRIKDGKPCDFYLEKDILTRGKTATVEKTQETPILLPTKKVSSFKKNIEAVYNRALLVGEYPEELDIVVHEDDLGDYDDNSFKAKKGLMNWSILGYLDYYAINHLLIKPWIRSGENEETWEQYLERFYNTPWINKSSVRSKKKLDAWLKNKRKRMIGIEKTVEIFKDLPGLQKKIRKHIKKDIKKQEKILPKDIQEQFYHSLSSKKDLDAYQTSTDIYDTDPEDIEDTGSVKSLEDSGSASSEEDDIDDERSEYEEELDDEEPNEKEEDYDIGIFD